MKWLVTKKAVPSVDIECSLMHGADVLAVGHVNEFRMAETICEITTDDAELHAAILSMIDRYGTPEDALRKYAYSIKVDDVTFSGIRFLTVPDTFGTVQFSFQKSE